MALLTKRLYLSCGGALALEGNAAFLTADDRKETSGWKVDGIQEETEGKVFTSRWRPT